MNRADREMLARLRRAEAAEAAERARGTINEIVDDDDLGIGSHAGVGESKFSKLVARPVVEESIRRSNELLRRRLAGGRDR